MTISSPLDITWDHAYWTEGPRFRASLRRSRWGVGVAKFAGRSTGMHISIWPDEVDSLDLVQAAAGSQPTYQPSDANWGGRPAVLFADVAGVGSNHMHSAVLGSPISQPFDIVVLCRHRLGSGFYNVAVDGVANNVQVGTNSSPTGWVFYMTSVLTGGTVNTSAHMLRARADATDVLYLDETSVVSGAAGATALDGVSLGGRTGFNNWAGEIVFVGIKAGGLSAGDISGLHALATSLYGIP